MALSPTPMHRAQDFQGNLLKRGAFPILDVAPLFNAALPLAAGEYGPSQIWQLRSTNQMCWYNEGGAMVCVGDVVAASETLNIALNTGDALPMIVPPEKKYVFIDVNSQAGDLSLDGWAPTATGLTVLFRVRKTNTDGGAITWTDPSTGTVYSFVDKQGEFITLIWDALTTTFSIA